MWRKVRNWLGETPSEETERRLSAVESSVAELWLAINILTDRTLVVEHYVKPAEFGPEEG